MFREFIQAALNNLAHGGGDSLGILKEYPNEREQVLAQLMFAGLIDVQDRTVFRLSFTTGHRSYRARATIGPFDASLSLSRSGRGGGVPTHSIIETNSP